MNETLADALVVKNDNVFLVTPRDGTMPADREHAYGLWYRDCRFLSAHALLLNGAAPVLLQASDALGATAVHDLTNPELPLAPGERLRAQALSLRCERVLSEPALLRERLELRNHHLHPVRLRIELVLAADFAPMLAVRGLLAGGERPRVHAELDGAALLFSARGRDGVLRTSAIELRAAPAEAELSPGEGAAGATLRFDAEIRAGGSHELALTLTAAEAPAPAGAPARRAAAAGTRVRSDEQLFDRVLARSLQDLAMLRSRLDGRAYYSAGVPWYATLFGRDSLIAATQMLAFEPGVAADTLRLLGGLLGRERDDTRDEQPGRVLHELRVGEPAALGETPFARYYGTVDATPLWLGLLADHSDWSGSLDLFRELRPQVRAALDWLGRDGDSLIEYRRRAPQGLINQGWRDSWDGVPGADGAPLEAPIALVEVQGYALRALRGVARLFELDGDGAEAERLRGRAAELELALERFWLPDAGSYAIALDGDGRPGSGLTSNPGHLLWAGALPGERASRVRDALMSADMFSGWGVRTLGSDHAGYNPLGYHTGSVWPHDNALIACGLRGYGFDDDFDRLFGALLEAASQFADYRLPELFGGQQRTPGESPVPYPVACRPQAWAAGAIPYLLTTGLGLQADGLARRLRVVRPLLPPWVGRLEVEGLRVAGAGVDLRFERSGDEVALTDASVDGELEVQLA